MKERIKNNIQIESYIGQFVALKRIGDSLTALCPFHREKTPSFSVNSKKGFYYCFGCKASGDIFSFVMDYHKVTFPQSLEILSKYTGFELKEAPEEPWRKINNKAKEEYIKSMTDEAYSYLTSRGIDKGQIVKFGIGYSPKGGIDIFQGRITFPIHDRRGDVIGFTARAIGDTHPKYKNSITSSHYNKSSSLYNIENLKTGTAILVEGVLDVIGLSSHVDNVISNLGTAFTQYHARAIRNICNEVIIMYDNDTAGRNGAFSASLICLNEGIESYVVYPQSDPFDLSKEGADSIKEMLSTKISVWDCLINDNLKDIDLKTPEGKQEAVKRSQDIAAKITDINNRNIYLNYVSDKIGLNEIIPKREPTQYFQQTFKTSIEIKILSEIIKTPTLLIYQDRIDSLIYNDDDSPIILEWLLSQKGSGLPLTEVEFLNSKIPNSAKEKIAKLLLEDSKPIIGGEFVELLNLHEIEYLGFILEEKLRGKQNDD